MKVGTKLQYEVPDGCSEDCSFVDDLDKYGQSSICIRCPVLNCVDGPMGPIIEPEHYRNDWAREWEKFFKGEIERPALPLRPGENNDA